MPGILLAGPVATGDFNNLSPEAIGFQVIFVLTCNLAGPAAGTAGRIKKKAVLGGHFRAAPVFSTCTMMVCWALPNASGVHRSEVSTFIDPPLSIPSSSGFHHAP